MIPATQRLLEESDGRKLTTSERRQCVAYLMATSPDTTNDEMAARFQVSDRTIRMDKKHIRGEKAKLIKEDDIGLVIADILIDYERLINDIEKSSRAAKPGSATYLNHKTAQMDMRLKTTKALQDLGYLPKNLGTMSVDRFEYRAEVDKSTGQVTTRPVSLFDDDTVIDAEIIGPKQLEAGDSSGRSEETNITNIESRAEDHRDCTSD
jgi:hypothetical protein